MIVYPMGLPPYDEVRLILEDKEELAGKQVSAHQWAMIGPY